MMWGKWPLTLSIVRRKRLFSQNSTWTSSTHGKTFLTLNQPYSRIFHSCGDITFAGEGLQILTHTWYSWPLSSEGSLVCHTYCGMGHPFIMVISKEAWHSHLLPSVLQLSLHYLFLRLRSVVAGISTPNLSLVRQTL